MERSLALIAILALGLAAWFDMAGCSGGAASTLPSPAWTPAPKLTASASSFQWADPTNLRGTLQPETWTYTASFPLPGGPATVTGILRVPGSTSPRFTACLMPDEHAPRFPGYAAQSAYLWHLPLMTADEGALTDWFPYALPAGTYRLMMRQVGGAQTGGTYDVWVAGVK